MGGSKRFCLPKDIAIFLIFLIMDSSERSKSGVNDGGDGFFHVSQFKIFV
jgi:hypothetical protein